MMMLIRALAFCQPPPFGDLLLYRADMHRSVVRINSNSGLNVVYSITE